MNAETAPYCYLDFDINQERNKLATCAEFVHQNNLTYGLSSNNLLHLGGAEVARLPDLIAHDHQWSTRRHDICTTPPPDGQRLVIQLYWDVAPRACANFATLCSNGSSSSSTTQKIPLGDCGKPLTYRDCPVHRLIPDFILQTGDFVLENGAGGECSFPHKKVFKDERPGLALKHDRFGLLSMGNSGKNSNSSQFFFTLHAQGAPQCDGKHVIFGECISGQAILHTANTYGRQEAAATNGGDATPTVPITITDCGVYQPLVTPGAGFWYDQPAPASFAGVSSTFMVRPRVAVLAHTEKVLTTYRHTLGTRCAIVTTWCCGDNTRSKHTTHTDDDAAVAAAHMTTIRTAARDLLAKFAIDLLVVAPACQHSLHTPQLRTLPDSWTTATATANANSNASTDRRTPRLDTMVVEEVILVAKPIEALAVIQTHSWIAKYRTSQHYWHLDGC